MYTSSTEHNNHSLYKNLTEFDYTYDQLAQQVMNHEGVLVLGEFYQLINAIVSADPDNFKNMSQEELYKVFILDYLRYDYTTSEYQSKFAERVLKYSTKIYKGFLDHKVDIRNDKEALKKLSFDERLKVIGESNLIKKYIQPYIKAMEDIDKGCTTAYDFEQNVATILAVSESNEERILFLKSVRNKAKLDGNDSLCSAIDSVIEIINNSPEAIKAESISKSSELTISYIIDKGVDLLKKNNPAFKAAFGEISITTDKGI